MTEKIKDNAKITVGVTIQILLLLVTIVSLFKTLEAKTNANTVNQEKHEQADAERWVKSDNAFSEVRSDISRLESVQTEMRISQAKQETHYAHIQSELNEIKSILKTFEVE